MTDAINPHSRYEHLCLWYCTIYPYRTSPSRTDLSGLSNPIVNISLLLLVTFSVLDPSYISGIWLSLLYCSRLNGYIMGYLFNQKLVPLLESCLHFTNYIC